MRARILLLSSVVILALGLPRDVPAETADSGLGKIKVSGLLQFWFQHTGGADSKETFRLRRALIKLGGKIKPEVTWKLSVDPAMVREDNVTKTEGNVTSVGRKSPLQDFAITFEPMEYLSFDFGQYKVPFGMEGRQSASKLDFAERSALSALFKWSNLRDLGVTCNGNFSLGTVKVQPAIGIFNGEGQNRLNANEPMAFVGRVVVQPTKALHLGASHYNRTSTTEGAEIVRTGAEFKLQASPLALMAEYAGGKRGDMKRETGYATATYKLSDSYQIAARYDWYDPDKDSSEDAKAEMTVGLNYFIQQHKSKIQLNYVFRAEEGTSVSDDLVRINVQVAY